MRTKEHPVDLLALLLESITSNVFMPQVIQSSYSNIYKMDKAPHMVLKNVCQTLKSAASS